MSVLSKRLKEARERKKLSQVEVYRLTSINNKTLSGYEHAVSEPDPETIKILADLYGVTTDFLIGHDPVRHAITGSSYTFDKSAIESALAKRN